jgi:exodeoxyribonuclease VII large subunit
MLSALSPRQRLFEGRQRLMDMEERLSMMMDHKVSAARAALAVDAQRLEGLSPLRQLARGYAYLHDEDGHGIVSTDQVKTGQLLTAQVTDGEIETRVISIRELRR